MVAAGGQHSLAIRDVRVNNIAENDKAVSTSDCRVLRHIDPTVIDARGGLRRAVRVSDAIRYPNGLPLLCISAAEGGSEDFTITRLFWYKEDYVPAERPGVVRTSKFNHWLPVPDGPVTRTAVQERNDGKTILVPTESLPDGVYALHNGRLDWSKNPPTFYSPFIVRGYGQPKIEKADVSTNASSVTLRLSVRNVGDGTFDDGFVVATLQRVEEPRNKFIARQHGTMESITPGKTVIIAQEWDTTKLDPGDYYFFGHVNYKYMWDTNRLDSFRSTLFRVPEEPL